MSARLEVLNAMGQVTEKVAIAIEQRVITLGRAETCTLRLRDPLASKTHAEISVRDGHYEVKDLGSRNGSYVNDKRLEGPTALEDGDIVRVGATRVRFRVEGAGAARTARAATTLAMEMPVIALEDVATDLASVKAATGRIAKASEPVTLMEELLAYFYGLADAEAAEVVLLEPGDAERKIKPLLRVAVDSRVGARKGISQFGVSRVADPNAPPLPNARPVIAKLVADLRAVDGSEVGFAPGDTGISPARLGVPIAGAGRLFGYVYVERAAQLGAFSPAEAARVGIVCDALAAYLRGVFEA